MFKPVKTKDMNKKVFRSARIEDIDRMANDIAASISAAIAKNKPKSMLDSYIALVSAVGKVVQTTSLILGTDAKEIGKIIADGIRSYFDSGGDPRIEILHKIMQEEEERERFLNLWRKI